MAPSSTFTTLRTLHAVIGDALSDIERIYAAHPGSKGIPLDYPSLDVPYYPAAPHTPEEEAAEKLAIAPEVLKAASHIVAACGQLTASVHRPFYSVIDGTFSADLGACVQFLEASNTVEILRAAGPAGLHAREIAQRIDTMQERNNADAAATAGSKHVPVDPGKLAHILRLLATHHWLREVRPDVFATNRISALLDSGKTPEELHEAPQNKYSGKVMDSAAAFVAFASDETAKSVVYTSDALLPARARPTALRALFNKSGASEEVDGTEKGTLPFNTAFRTPLPFFQWLELPENHARLDQFGRSMAGARSWEVAENVIDAYPWGELAKDSVVIDVGGGIGSTSVVLANALPHLKFVVQDRKQVVEMAPSLWDAGHAELFSSGRVSFLAQDFFSPQPPTIQVPGVGTISSPAVYVIRGCTHNWPDAAVHKMLRNLRDRAQPDTRLFLVEMILPLACRENPTSEAIPGANETLAPEGSPLLPNLGRASANGYYLDITMMAILDSKERTWQEISELALSAGWKVSRVVRAPGSLWAYVSAEPI